MKLITMIYILNATFILLHEIEAAYEKEWQILKLPGKITGFLLMHIPIILILFFGAIEISNSSKTGYILGIVTGIGGILPFAIHKIIIKKKESFNRPISLIIIYSNFILGHIVMLLSLKATIWHY